MGQKLNILHKLGIGLAFLVLIVIFAFFALQFGPLTPPYFISFMAGTIEVLLVAIYLLVIRGRISLDLRKKIYSYSIQLIVFPFLIIPFVISVAIPIRYSFHMAIIAYATAFFVCFGLLALVLTLARFLKKLL